MVNTVEAACRQIGANESQRNRLDLIGQWFGRLQVVAFAGSAKGRTRWHCECDCGGSNVVRGDILTSGHTRSCGCLNRETAAENGRKSLKNLVGHRFGRLTVMALADVTKRGAARWIAYYDCGGATVVNARHLTSGGTRSCGCFAREISAENLRKLSTTHGASNRCQRRTPKQKALYECWQGMRKRCFNPNCKSFKN